MKAFFEAIQSLFVDFLFKPWDWLRELEPFRAKYADRVVAEGVSFGVYAVCWMLVSSPSVKPAVKKSK